MSHISRKTARKSHSLKIFLYGCLFLCLFTALDVLTSTAHAATVSTTRQPNTHYILKTNLEELSAREHATLDWAKQSYELSFNLPSHDWYENLDLFLTAYPEGKVDRHTPLMLSYNGADPIALHGQGSKFDAHIRLDPSRIRAAGNTIKITFQAPKGNDCLTPKNGKWVLDLAHSKLVAKARPKRRDLHLAEIEPRLIHPMTSPKRVAILAQGTNAHALEAILASGIAMRTHTLPSFQFTQTNADFTVLIGTHTQLRHLVKNKAMLRGETPSMFIDTGKRPKLVLAAKTESQLTELARTFSSYHLPSTRKSSATLYELYSNAEFKTKRVLKNKRYKFSDLGVTNIAASWRPQATKVNFNVENAHASTGKLVLHINASENTPPESKLRIKLNDRSIGYTYLNKAKKKVSFDIPQGVFMAANNTLTIEPEFQTPTGASSCLAKTSAPSITLGKRSTLKLSTTTPSASTDLNRIITDGAPFVNTGTDTTLVLTARKAKDRIATLQFLGFAARQFGPQWVTANYVSTFSNSERDQNILILGPTTNLTPDLMTAAPSALKLALSGQASTGTNISQVALLERHAALNGDQAFQSLARAMGTPARINNGGVAALFPSPYAKDKLIGIISATKPSQFANAMENLSTQDYWNALQGSVSRWNEEAVLMAQIAKPTLMATNTTRVDFSSWKHTLQSIKQWSQVNYKAKISHWIDAKFSSETDQKQPALPQPKLATHQVNASFTDIPVPTLKSVAKHHAAQVPQQHTTVLAQTPSTDSGATALESTGFMAKVSGWGTNIGNMVQTQTWKSSMQKMVHNRGLMLILIVLSVFFIAGSIPSRLSSKR